MFWKKNKVQNKFEYVKLEEKNQVVNTNLRLTNCEWTDIVVAIGSVKFQIDQDNDLCGMNYSYDITEIPEGFDMTLLEDEKRKELEILLGDIIVYLLEEQMKESK